MKLNDIRTILESVDIPLGTAQHVLKHPDVLSGMPASGAQGRHREFSVHQAWRLAACCVLISAGGLSLNDAAKVVDFCEKEMNRAHQRYKPTTAAQIVQFGLYSWTVDIINRKLVRLRKPNEHLPKEGCYSIAQGKIVAIPATHIAVLRVDLSRLKLQLMKFVN